LNRPAPDRLHAQLMYVIRPGRAALGGPDGSVWRLPPYSAPETVRLADQRPDGRRAQPTMEKPADPVSAVEFAAYVVAVQEGAVQRIFRRHYPMPSGLCAGCLATPTPYPCQVARIAELAEQHPEYRGARKE
jgi:hypothetical protein